ncbi:MAG: DUF4468 domain-containing protein [Desulfobacterales bacterium]
MKKICGMVLLWLTVWGCANTPPPEPAGPEDLFIRQVSEIPGFSKAQLYEGAKLWVGGSFSDDLDVIRYSDRYEGMIVGQTYIPYERQSKWGSEFFDCRFTVVVEVKDNKIRTTFKELYLFQRGGIQSLLKSDMEIIRPMLEKAVEALVSSYKKVSTDSNW